MGRPAFAGRRAASRTGQLLAFGGIVMVVSGALAVLGGALAPLLDDGARGIVAQSGPTASAIRLEARPGTDAAGQDETVRATVAGTLPGARVERSVTGTAATADGEAVLLLADPDSPMRRG